MFALSAKLEPLATVLLWPLLLKITLAGFFSIEVSYALCIIGEFSLFGLCRIIGVGLGLVRRDSAIAKG